MHFVDSVSLCPVLKMKLADYPVESLNPCMPSPCGANAVCREQNGVGACQCVDNYFGNPYEGCRPECVLNSDCASDKACIRYKCVDPCPGICGQNAECLAVNHLPTCNCLSGYSGDAYRYCHLVQNERKSMGNGSLSFFSDLCLMPSRITTRISVYFIC